MLPLMVISIFSAIVLLLGLLQVGSAHVIERKAETASDAAALAAAEAYASIINATPPPLVPNYAAAQALAASRAPMLAAENDATLIGYQPTGIGPTWQVTVTVETNEGVASGLVGAITGEEAQSTSTAGVVVNTSPTGLGSMSARLEPNP